MSPAMSATKAGVLEARVTEATEGLKRAWSRLAKALYEFKQEKAYEALGFASFNAWATSDRCAISPGYAAELAKLWGHLVVDQGRDPATFSMLDFRGLQQFSRTLAPAAPMPPKLRQRSNGVSPPAITVQSATADEEFASTPGGQAILRSMRLDLVPVKDAVGLVVAAKDPIRRREALIDLAAAALAEANQLLERRLA